MAAIFSRPQCVKPMLVNTNFQIKPRIGWRLSPWWLLPITLIKLIHFTICDILLPHPFVDEDQCTIKCIHNICLGDCFGHYFDISLQLKEAVKWTIGMNSLQWRHNERGGVSNHQRLDCLPNRLFRHRSKKTSKLRVTGLCERNTPVAGEFPAQKTSNADMFPFNDAIMLADFCLNSTTRRYLFICETVSYVGHVHTSSLKQAERFGKMDWRWDKYQNLNQSGILSALSKSNRLTLGEPAAPVPLYYIIMLQCEQRNITLILYTLTKM